MKNFLASFCLTTSALAVSLFFLNRTAPAPSEPNAQVADSATDTDDVLNATYQKRISFWSKKLLLDPYSSASRKQLAKAHRDLARSTGDEAHYVEAEKLLREAIKLQPGDVSSLQVELADTIMAFHRFDEAWQIVDQALRQNPTAWWMYGVRGDAALGMGRYEQAKDDFERFAQNDPGFSSYTRLAHILQLYGQNEKSVFLLTAARDRLQGTSPEPVAWIELRLGIHYLNRMQLPQAERHFRASLKAAPNYYLAQEHLAEIYERKDELDLARPLLESAIATHPDPLLVLRLAKIEQEQGDRSKSEKLRSQALDTLQKRAQESDAHVRDFAEVLINEKRELPLAIELLQRDLRLRGGDLRSNYLLATAYRLNGDLDDARRYISKACRLDALRQECSAESQLLAETPQTLEM